jgi:hypothetical protein
VQEGVFKKKKSGYTDPKTYQNNLLEGIFVHKECAMTTLVKLDNYNKFLRK